jgi:hypothetical protein
VRFTKPVVAGDTLVMHMNLVKYPGNRKNVKLPDAQSLMTYRRHAILCNLIRCYFFSIIQHWAEIHIHRIP